MRATFQSSGTKQVRWFPGMGRCSRAQRAPREPPHRRKRQGGQARRGVPAARPAPRAPAPPRLAMVEQGDAAPLLRWAEGPAVSVPQDPALQAGGWVRGGSGGGRAAAEAARRREPDEPAPPEVLLQPGRLELGDVEEDQVVAVFVVTFDPRSGESHLGMEGWGAVEEAAHWVSGGAGEGLAAHALAPTHLHPSLPGGPGARGRCGSRLEPRDPGGFVPPPAPSRRRRSQCRSPICSASVREDWFAAAGTLAFVFSVFQLGWKVLRDAERKKPLLTPAYVASHAGSERPCSAPALARGCSLRRNFPSRLVHFLRRLHF